MAGAVAKIFLRGSLTAKFRFATHRPQQIHINFGSLRLRSLQKRGGITIKSEKDIIGLHFGTLAMLGIDQISGIVLLHNGGHFELAGFFIKQVFAHGGGLYVKEKMHRRTNAIGARLPEIKICPLR